MRLTSWVNTHPFQLSHCAANQRQKGSYHAKSTLISRSSSRGLLMSRVVPFSSACCFTPNQTIRCLHITPQLQKCSPRNQAQEREASVTLPPSNSIMYRNLLFKWRCRIRWRERWHRSWFGSKKRKHAQTKMQRIPSFWRCHLKLSRNLSRAGQLNDVDTLMSLLW